MSYVGETLSNLLHQTAFFNLTWGNYVMILVAFIFLYLAIKKGFEPLLLVPIAFGMLLVNIYPDIIASPEQTSNGVGGLLYYFYTLDEWSILPSLIFMGVGAMTDFGPLIANPKSFLLGAAAQFGIFFTFFVASFFFDVNDAASIAIIGAADGPTSIFVANELGSKYIGAIMVAAYSYMALVPIVQPPVIKAVTSKKERLIRMKYNPGDVSKTTKILFPIVVTVIAGLVAPKSVALVGFLMFGNLIRECGVLNNLSETAQNSFANIITILLGITVAGQMHYKEFVQPATLLILGLGLVAFVFDTIGGVVFAKFLNLFLPKDKKINPMIGAAGISAFPMSGRVVNQMGLKEDNQNFLLMQSISVNVSGQIASVIAGGLILTLVS